MPVPLDMFSPFKYFNVAPVTDWERFINPQFNITLNQGDAAMENRVLASAGSYGKQIGQMQEVLDILITRLPTDALTAVERRSVEKYQTLRAEVVATVQAAKPRDETTARKEDVENWLDRLARVRDSDPAQFEQMAARIGRFLADADADAGGPRAPQGRKGR